MFILACRGLPREAIFVTIKLQSPEDLMSLWESTYKHELVEWTFPTGRMPVKSVFEERQLSTKVILAPDVGLLLI